MIAITDVRTQTAKNEILIFVIIECSWFNWVKDRSDLIMQCVSGVAACTLCRSTY